MAETPTLKEMQKTFEHKSIVNFLDDAYSLGNSTSTKELYRTMLYSFNRFCVKTYEKNIVEIVSNLKDKPIEEIMPVFVDYKRHMDKTINQYGNPISNHTKRLRISILKQFLRSCGIKIHQEDISDYIKIGRRVRVKKYALDHETVAKIIEGMNNFEFKALSTLLASTGMRVMEAITMHPEDFDFNSFPVLVNIRAKQTKTKEARTVYLTKECAGMIEQLINNKPEWQKYLFGKRDNADGIYETYSKAFRRVICKLGLYKILENGFNQVTIHSFRQFFRTYAGHLISRDFAESFIGHSFYLSEYENMPEEERKKIFLHLEPHMTFLEPKIQKPSKNPEVIALERQLNDIEGKVKILARKFLAQPNA